MATNLERRVTRLEREFPRNCPHGYYVVQRENEEPTGPEVCPECGLPGVVYNIVYGEDERRAGGQLDSPG